MSMGISQRLWLGFGAVAAITIGSGTWIVLNSSDALRGVHTLMEVDDTADMAKSLSAELSGVRLAVLRYREDTSDLRERAARDAAAKVDQTLEAKAAASPDPEIAAKLDAFRRDWAEYSSAFDSLAKATRSRDAELAAAFGTHADAALARLEEIRDEVAREKDAATLWELDATTAPVQSAIRHALMYAQTLDEEALRQANEQIEAARASLGHAVESEEHPAHAAILRGALNAWEGFATSFAAGASSIVRVDQIESGALDVIGPKLAEVAESITAHCAEQTETAEAALLAASSNVRLISLVGAALSAAAAGVLGFFVARSITGPLNRLTDRVRDVAEGEGDLTKRVQIQGDDELARLGGLVNKFLERMHQLMREVGGSTREVAAAATEIAASSEQMAAGMQRQLQQADQVSSAVGQMTTTVSEVARQSGEAAQSARGSQDEAGRGGAVVNETVEEINAIAEDVNQSARAVASLGKKGEQIGAIIEVINDIADQTNLLALNAAIEAARAGEHGRGFAVVADEVRKLAERTQQATEEVSKSIREIQSETKGAVERIEAGSKRVTRGVELANSAGMALSSIVGSSKVLASMIDAIAAASEEQSASSEQISRSVGQITAVTRESSEGAGQAARAASDLSRQAERLQSLVGRFKV